MALETKTAVKTLAIRPITRVTANPFTGPVPNKNRNAQDTTVVTCVSMMVRKAFPKPASTAAITVAGTAKGINATTNGTAVAPGDYVATNGILSWAEGDGTPKLISVSIVNDTLVEGNETFAVILSNPTGSATLATPSVATVTITDDAGNTSQQVISVTVSAVADITGDSLTTNEDTAISANVLTGTNTAIGTLNAGDVIWIAQSTDATIQFAATAELVYIPASSSFTP